MSWYRMTLLPVLFFAWIPENLPAQGFAQNTKDAAEIRGYTLSIGDVRKWFAAQKALVRLEQEHPEIREAAGKIDQDDWSLDDFEKKVNQVTPARGVLRSHGITARQFAVISISYMQAGMIYWASQQGQQIDMAPIKKDMNPANATFFQQHHAELTRLQQEIEALQKQKKNEGDEEEQEEAEEADTTSGL